MSSCSCCFVPGCSSWLCASGTAAPDDSTCLVRNTSSRTYTEPQQPPADLLEDPDPAAEPQQNHMQNNNNNNSNSMDIEVLREQYRWTRDQQRTETRVLLFRQVSQELCDAANIVPVAQGLPLPPAAGSTPCGTPPLTFDPWHTHLGLHRRACLHVGGGVSLKAVPPATGTSFTSSSWPASSLSDTTGSSLQGAAVRRFSVDSKASRRVSFSDVSAVSSVHSGDVSAVSSVHSRDVSAVNSVHSGDVSAVSSVHSVAGDDICKASKATEPSDGSPRGSPEGSEHHPTHLSRVDVSPEGSLSVSPQLQPPSTFPRYASREEEEMEETDSSVSVSRGGSPSGSPPEGSKDSSGGEGSSSSSDDAQEDRNVLTFQTVGPLHRDNNNTTVTMATVVEAVPDDHRSQWNGGSRTSRKLSAPSLTRQSSLGGLGGCHAPQTLSLTRQSSLGGCQAPQTPSLTRQSSLGGCQPTILTRQSSLGGYQASQSPSAQRYYPFPNRKTPTKSEAARKLGMYSSF